MSVQYVQAAQGKRGDKLAPRSIWQREPLNTLWAGSIFLRILAIQLPYFSLKYLLPSLRPIKTWSWGRAMLIALIRQKGRFRPTGKLVIRINFEGDQKATFKPHPEGTPVWIPKLEKPLTGELGEMMAKSGDTLARNSAWWYGKDHSKKPDGKGKVILYFHGGTYFEYGSHPASPPTAPLRLSLAATSKIGNEPVRGLALEYRLSHIASLPGIISDAVAAWRYLVEDCGYSPEDIVVGGDSAGGHLTLALTRYLINEKPFGEGLPKGLLLFSPWIDISMSYAHTPDGKRFERTDYVGIENTKLLAANVLRDCGPTSPLSLYASNLTLARPVTGKEFANFPPALVHSGDAEVLVDEIASLTKHYGDAGSRLDAHVYKDACHDFVCLPKVFPQEKALAIKRTSAWLQKLWA